MRVKVRFKGSASRGPAAPSAARLPAGCKQRVAAVVGPRGYLAPPRRSGNLRIRRRRRQACARPGGVSAQHRGSIGAGENRPRIPDAVGRPRRRHRSFRRRHSARRRHHPGVRPHEPHPGDRPGKRARRSAARRGQSRSHAGRARHPAISTRPIPPASAPAPSAAMSRKTPADRTLWPTGSPPITCSAWSWCCRMGRWSRPAARRPTCRATTSPACSPDRKAPWRWSPRSPYG